MAFPFSKNLDTHNALLILAPPVCRPDCMWAESADKNAEVLPVVLTRAELSKVCLMTQNGVLCINWRVFADKSRIPL